MKILICILGLVSAVTVQAVPNDPFAASQGSWGQEFADQWALEALRVYADIAPQDPGEPVVVAVIDTGLDFHHEDLAQEKIWHNPAERKNGRDDDNNGFIDDLVGWNFADHNNAPWDHSGHGTHIAGAIAACTNNGLGIAGVNPTARIMPLKVANFAGQARSSSVAAAIYYAVDNGARVINISLGGELITELERNAAEYAQQRGVLIVASAGNKGLKADQHGYAALPGVLAVGASDLHGVRAGFSNYGEHVALVAPGVDVLSLRAKDTDFIQLSDPLDYVPEGAVVGEAEQYYRASGTSFSAALVSGVASRVLSHRPNLNAEDLHRLLTQSAADIAPPGLDQLTGYGAVNYIGALAGDPNRFVEARLSHAELDLQENELWVHVHGSAAGSEFARAELWLRAGEGAVPEPTQVDGTRRKSRKEREAQAQAAAQREAAYQWQTAAAFAHPQADARLLSISIDDLAARTAGAASWELRLTVASTDGTQREASMTLAMPKPEVYSTPDVASDGAQR